MSKHTEKYAWFSKEQAYFRSIHLNVGTATWATSDGKLIEVTLVSDSSEHGTKFTDMVYVGKVCTFVRNNDCVRHSHKRPHDLQ